MARLSSECGSGSRYPYPSTLNTTTFVSMKLSGTHDYPLWKTQMVCLVESQELDGFIDGTILPPPETMTDSINHGGGGGITTEDGVVANEEYRLWKRSDRLVKSWILGSLQEHVLATVVGLSTARSVWTKLLSTFGPNPQDHQSAGVIPEENDVSQYLPLYKAALVGDWETAKTFLDDNEENAATASITSNRETLLHVAVSTGKAIHFVKKLVERLPKETLDMKICLDQTPLTVAATIGNTIAAKILVEKNPSLLNISNISGNKPLHVAADMGHWDTFSYLQSVSNVDDFAGQAGIDLLCLAINNRNYNIALKLIERYPQVAKLEPTQKIISPLILIAGKSSSFQSGHQLNFLQSFIYSCIPVKLDNFFDGSKGGDHDIELQATNSKAPMHKRVQSMGVRKRLHVMLLDVMRFLVPAIKNLGEKKLVHHQAVQLVKCLCEGIRSSSNDQRAYAKLTCEAVIKAASLGIVEAVEGIVDIFPSAFWSNSNRRHYITQLAVLNRSEKVFNLIYQMSGYKYFITTLTDDAGNNILHLAGQLAPSYKLNLVSGAALQMQRELQWFKEVEKLNPTCSEKLNSSRETPAMVFSRDHKQLVIDGEKWMKDTANSCTIAAALIITMVFAAAITVPGGNNEDSGLPIFKHGDPAPAFLLFAVTNAISLFTSTTSLLMFLSILTARYAEQDFLHALPARLVLGLLTLFLSITSMIIAFSTTVYLVFGERKGWVIIPLVALSCLPITSFVTLQFPLLIDVFSSTFGRGIFGKQSDRPFH